MATKQKRLTIFDQHVGICQLGFFCPQAFYLPSLQSDTRLESVLDEIVVACFFVVHDNVVGDFCFLCFGHPFIIARSCSGDANLIMVVYSP